MSRVAVLTLLALVAVPLFLPLTELIRQPSGLSALLEAPRITTLVGNTLALAAGAVLIAVPAGTIAALLIERGRVSGRSALRGLVLLGVFVPLPVYAAAWQAAFGALGLPDSGGWRPWRAGLLPAVWVHAVAGLPWVAGFVVLALGTTDPQLEDDARLTGGTRAVWWGVLWPRVRVAALAGGAWVMVQTLTESTVTDLFMVRTFAEEVYFQLVGNPAGVAAAVAVTLPVWLGSAGAAGLVLSGIVRSSPSPASDAAASFGDLSPAGRGGGGRRLPCTSGNDQPHRPLPGGVTRAKPPYNPPESSEQTVLRSVPGEGSTAQTVRRWFPFAFLIWIGAIALVAVPLCSLALRTGGVKQFLQVARAHGFTLAASVLWSVVAGLAAAVLALAACWRARDSRRWAGFVLVLSAVAWVTPAPLIGLGLKTLIRWLVQLEDSLLGVDAAFAPLRSLLYDQPSPLPGVWAAALRFFPVAVAVLWPAVRSVPRELIDAATLEGGRRAVWRAAVWPCVRRSFAAAVAAVGLLSLGEVVATKLVQAPGQRSFVGDLFDAMHYGADATVAAMCLLQIAATAGLCAVLRSRLRLVARQ